MAGPSQVGAPGGEWQAEVAGVEALAGAGADGTCWVARDLRELKEGKQEQEGWGCWSCSCRSCTCVWRVGSTC